MSEHLLSMRNKQSKILSVTLPNESILKWLSHNAQYEMYETRDNETFYQGFRAATQVLRSKTFRYLLANKTNLRSTMD